MPFARNRLPPRARPLLWPATDHDLLMTCEWPRRFIVALWPVWSFLTPGIMVSLLMPLPALVLINFAGCSNGIHAVISRTACSFLELNVTLAKCLSNVASKANSPQTSLFISQGPHDQPLLTGTGPSHAMQFVLFMGFIMSFHFWPSFGRKASKELPPPTRLRAVSKTL